MEVGLDVVPLPWAMVVLMVAMAPGIESVSKMVQLEHCCHTPWIVFWAVQLVCHVPRKSLTLFLETFLVPWSQKMPPVYLDQHSLLLVVLDALLLAVEIDSGLVSPNGQKDL